ncbi:MAG: DUF3348 family protein [Pseudomonadales bacterium]
MTTAAPINYSGSRMIRFLDELGVNDEPVSPARFSGRLAELIDLSQSVKISLAHTSMSEMEFEAFDSSIDTARTEFIRVHSEVTEIIVQSFAQPEGFSRLKSPPPTTLQNDDKKAALKSYLNFYLYYQRMLESKVSRLRDYTRDAASGLSIKLAQLAKLDEVLGETLAAHDRKSFARVPVLLEQRLALQLSKAQPDQLAELHDSFCKDLQALLLAESEVRLLPVLGLIETIESEALDSKTGAAEHLITDTEHLEPQQVNPELIEPENAD